MNRLKERYETEIVKSLMEKYGYKSVMQCPKVEKVVCVPGNGGTAKENKCVNIDISSCSYLKEDGTIGNYLDGRCVDCEYEIKAWLRDLGYRIEPTGYIGGVWQRTEDICW